MDNFKSKESTDKAEIDTDIIVKEVFTDKEILKELNPFLDELTEIAKDLVQDYNQNPPDVTDDNIIIEIDQDSPYLEDSDSNKK